MKEFDEKLTDEDRTSLNEKLDTLKKAYADKEVDKLDEAGSALNEAWSAISTRLYQESAQQPEQEPQGGQPEGGTVEDADFEEVK
jgi:molecular chaperone DnaK